MGGDKRRGQVLTSPHHIPPAQVPWGGEAHQGDDGGGALPRHREEGLQGAGGERWSPLCYSPPTQISGSTPHWGWGLAVTLGLDHVINRSWWSSTNATRSRIASKPSTQHLWCPSRSPRAGLVPGHPVGPGWWGGGGGYGMEVVGSLVVGEGRKEVVVGWRLWGPSLWVMVGWRWWDPSL